MPDSGKRVTGLLRWSEKFMKTDMVYLAKGGFWLTLGQFVATASGLLLVVGFANLLPKEVYGTYKYVLSLAGIVAAFSLSGMGVAVTQAVARGFDGTLREAVRVQLRWSAVMALAAGALALWFFLRGETALAVSMLIVGALSPIIESASLYADFLVGKKDFRTGTGYGIVRSLVPFAALLVTMLFTKDVVPLVLAYFLSHAATSAALYAMTLRRHAPSPATDRSSLGFGKHVSLLNLLSIVAAQLDKVLVFHFLGPVQLAAYGIAFSLPAQMKIATKMLNTLALPKMSAATLETIRSAIWPKTVRLLLAYGAVVAAYVVAAPHVFRLLFPQYVDAVALSQLLALGYLFSPTQLFTQAFYALKRQRDIYVLKIATSAARILFLIVLLPPFGLWGAAAAFIAANAAGSAIAVLMFGRLKS